MANIKTTNYKIESNLNKKIILLSDLHYHSRKDLTKLEKVYQKLENINPDFICITGDFIDEAKVSDEDLFVFFLKKLSKICKVIISLGNHDIVLRHKNKEYFYNIELFNKIKKIRNVYLLDNETKVIGDICFVGINLGFDYYYNKNESDEEFLSIYNNLKLLNSKKYNILLCHSPLAVTTNKVINNLKNIDLVLCGHTHGGLTPTIFQKYLKNTILVSPNKMKLFLKNGYGQIINNNCNIIISSGITKLSSASGISSLDFLFTPEIVLIELKKENS